MARLLISGGAGFLGSHTCVALLEAGHQLLVFDSFSHARLSVPERIARIVGPTAAARLEVQRGDIRNPSDLERAFRSGDQVPQAVIHFAGLKAVAESVAEPLRYWEVNVQGTARLLEAMRHHGCRTLVFSSSAAVYGIPEQVPIPETAPLRPINPYGHTKAAVEQLLADVSASEPGWRLASLRYFNPIGAHPSALLGENPSAPPTNLFPILGQVARGERPALAVYGTDWPTRDGSGLRDYLHVMDLAEGHRAALEVLLAGPEQRLSLNLGTGRGTTVLELRAAFEQACGVPLPWRAAPRRPGDPATSVADARRASELLGWHAQHDLAAMCDDGWRWLRHPRSADQA